MLNQSKVHLAVVAAMERVDTYRHFTKQQLDQELSWQLAEVRFTNKGFILWRGFELGRQLTRCLAEAQNWRCCYCGLRTLTIEANVRAPQAPTLEHVITIASGGEDHPDNLVIACCRCNTLRGAQELELFLRLMTYYRWKWRISHRYDDYPLPKQLI